MIPRTIAVIILTLVMYVVGVAQDRYDRFMDLRERYLLRQKLDKEYCFYLLNTN